VTEPAPRPVLNQLNLVARDFAATLDFYRRLGVEIPDRDWGDDVAHAEAEQANGFVLEFDDERTASIYHAGWRRPGGGSRALIGFALASDDAVDATYADLVAAGYEGRQVPYLTFWGARYAIVADPDGNDVGLMGPVDRARGHWPPNPSPDGP
jgi:uncharacterized glyoxalase superfamily protein PhnB